MVQIKTIKDYLQEQKFNKNWKKVIFICATIVSFITICLLIMPAITMESVLVCDLEHEHIEDCYEQRPKEITYICGKTEHTHNDTCYNDNLELTCLQEEHTHEDVCVEKTIIEEILYTTNILTIENDENETPLENENSVSSGDIIENNQIVENQTIQPFNIEEYITNVSIQYSNDNGYTWNNVENRNIKKDDILKFILDYEVPGGILSSTKNTITYQIPEEINIENAFEDNVYNKSGDIVGTYTISTNGLITIIFNEEFVEKNNSGQAIIGNVGFTANVSNIETNNSGNVILDFTNNVSIQLEVIDKYENTNDLQVEKQSQIVDVANNIVEYTIIVSSENGTSDNITLNDLMLNGIKYYSDLSIVDNNLNEITPTTTNGTTFQIETGATNFDMLLPPLNAQSKYIITYKGILENTSSGAIHTINEVVVNSKAQDGTKLRDNANVTTVFSQNMIQKTAIQSETEDSINWTITINKDNANINGYILSDVINGVALEENVLITSSDGTSFTTKLPYTFPNTTNSYTITYSTTKDRLIGEQNVFNKATLITPDGTIYEAEKNVWTTGTYGGQYNPISKTVIGTDANDNSGNYELTWNIEIDSKYGEIKAPIVLTDYLNGNQYFRKQDLKNLVNLLNEKSYNYDIIFYDDSNNETTLENLQENVKYKSFAITFNETISKNKINTIQYTSYAIKDESVTSEIFTNDAKLNNKVSTKATYKTLGTYYIEKVDALDVYSNLTYHDYYGSDYNNTTDDGLLYWTISSKLPANIDETITIEEILPEGLTLEKVSLQIENLFWNQEFVFENNIWTLTTNDHTIIANQNENTLSIVFQNELVQQIDQNEILINIRAKIKDDYKWITQNNINIGIFENVVNLKNEHNEILKTDTQTQEISKNDNYELLNKTSGLNGIEQTNIIPYFITINPEGKDIVENGDVYKLVDTLNFYGYSDNVTMSLIPSSLNVYKIKNDGTKELLSLDKYSYHYYTTTPPKDTPWIPHQSIINFELPDNIPLFIEYNYKVYGTEGQYIHNIKNDVSLIVGDETISDKETTTSIQIYSSTASANTKGVLFVKTDKVNNAIKLQNVEFKIYEWNGTKYKLLEINGSTSIYTNEDGEFALELKPNTAYKIEEITPPSGYSNINPIYIILNNENIETYPLNVPENFNGQQCYSTIPFLIENEKPITSLTINKVWKDANGVIISNPTNNATIELLRYAIPESIIDEIPKGPLTLTYSIGPDQWATWQENTKTIQENSFVRIYCNYNGYAWENLLPKVYLNGNSLENKLVVDTNYDDGSKFMYEFIMEENSEIIIYTEDWSESNWEFVWEITEPSIENDFDFTPYQDSSFNKTITLSTTNNWTYTWNNLEKLGSDKNGNIVHYKYYVRETPIMGYKTEIIQDTENHFLITNKQSGVNEYYELPATGGIGIELYLTLVGFFVIIVIVLLIKNNKK